MAAASIMDSIVDVSDLAVGATRSPIEDIDNASLRPQDMISVLRASLRQEGIAGHNIRGYNELINGGINHIMTKMFAAERFIRNERSLTESDRSRKSFNVKFTFHDVKIGKPDCTKYMTGKHADLYPCSARTTGQLYSAQITMGATVHITAIYDDGHVEVKTAEVPPFQIGGFPTMVGGVNCHTANCPAASLREMGEDSLDPGGYFIAKRSEYVVNLLENIRYNSPHIHRQMNATEHVRMEFLSQPGGAFDNSSQLQLRYMTNGRLTVTINSMKFEKVAIPFYVIYRLFGMTDDKSIVETIMFDSDSTSPLSTKIKDILSRAFHLADASFTPLMYELNRETLVRSTAERLAPFVTNPTAHTGNEQAVQYLISTLLSSSGLDSVLLPHMGTTAESRIRKLRFIGLMYYRMFLVHFNILPPTDRDSYRNKRVHGAGVSLAKAFKTQVNNNIVVSIYRAIKRELKNNSWESLTSKNIIDTFGTALATSDLNRALEQSITAGSKTIVIHRHAIQNRVSSQALERKNMLNTVSTLRQVITQNSGNSANSTERANVMRRVSPSYIGNICIAQSAESGESVGMHKQLAVTASVCSAGDALPLKTKLLADPAVIKLDDVLSPDLLSGLASRTFINGEWIGVTYDAPSLVRRYRTLRREGRVVAPHTTIAWDPVTNEVEFWLDVGRIRRPLMIVDNNIEQYNASCVANKADPTAERIKFVQNTRFTQAHAIGLANETISIDDLIRDGVMEWITPEEQENCWLAKSIKDLHADRNNVIAQYTHCDIEQAVFGIAAMVTPFGNHTQPARVTFETAHARQTGGWYALNFPFRTDKNRFLQFNNSVPLVSTFSNHIIPANGTNVMIAYMSFGGNNQEDSAILNRASTNRQLFAGAFFRFEIAVTEKGDQFGTPDRMTTKNIKPNANYEKLTDGFIREGSIVNFGDVLIGKITKLTGSDETYKYTDRSIVYRLQEPAVVEQVLHPRSATDELFVIVKLRYERPLRTGDKMSSRSGNKSIVAEMLQQSDMPWVERTGAVPDIIINTHSFPSRMTIGQLMETTQGKVGAHKGAITDGTAFLPVDHHDVAEELVALGYRYNGRERMHNGKDGTFIDAAIFIGPTAEQRIQKFILDDEQAVAESGPTDATTGQPLGGKRVQGGVKIGEMESWALLSHGSMVNLSEKTHQDSDGRTLYICRNCGYPAAYNEYENIYTCKTCGEQANIVSVATTKAAALFREELACANIRMQFGLRPFGYDEVAKP